MSQDATGTRPSKADLMARIDLGWTSLTAAIADLGEDRMTAPGPDGWSIKDQLAHISAWESSLAALLTGRSRAAAIGVDDATYETGDVDVLNGIIRERAQDQPLPVALDQLRRTHDELLAVIVPLTDEDLERPYSHYQPNDPRHNPNPVIDWIAGDTYEHYDEHLATIRRVANIDD